MHFCVFFCCCCFEELVLVFVFVVLLLLFLCFCFVVVSLLLFLSCIAVLILMHISFKALLSNPSETYCAVQTAHDENHIYIHFNEQIKNIT